MENIPFTEEEIRYELANFGYSNLPNETIAQFKKGIAMGLYRFPFTRQFKNRSDCNSFLTFRSFPDLEKLMMLNLQAEDSLSKNVREFSNESNLTNLYLN